jgi:TRAP-type C4-dicarboxylate transport system substrate-binding protein
MRRRDFIAGIAGLACAWPRTAAEARDFRVADTQLHDHPTARALVHMSELVSDRTQGRHRMIVYAGGLLGEQEASFEQTRTGGIDINRTNLAPLISFVGKANIFGLPYLFRSADHLHRILDGAIGDDILQSLEPHGFASVSHFSKLEQGRFTRLDGHEVGRRGHAFV